MQVWKEKQEFNFKHVKSELAIIHPVETFKDVVVYVGLQFKGRERNEDGNPKQVFCNLCC